MELLNLLIQNLGVNAEQAKGGAGLIFQQARDTLGDGDFGKIAAEIPGISDLLNAAPKSSGLGGAIASMTSGFGGGLEKLGGLAGLAGGFSKLGLESDMIGKFIPIVLTYVQSKGGETIKNLLAGALK